MKNKILARRLEVGTYDTTPKFASSPKHIAVCFYDDLGLVAVTGYADDTPKNLRESVAYARLFAESPAVVRAAQDLLEKLDNMTTESFGNGGERKEREALREAIEKALQGI